VAQDRSDDSERTREEKGAALMNDTKLERLLDILESPEAALVVAPGLADFAEEFNKKFGPIDVIIDKFLPADNIYFIDRSYVKGRILVAQKTPPPAPSLIEMIEKFKEFMGDDSIGEWPCDS